MNSEDQDFENLFESIPNQAEGVPTLEYDLPYPKEDFLRFIVKNKNFLLHGTALSDLKELEPRQANDGSKQSGNKNAVYAVEDPVMAMFFAIQNRENINGSIVSGTRDNPETGEQEYYFKVPKEARDHFWTEGVVYILDKANFYPEKDDGADHSGEWTSQNPVKPIVKLKVSLKDFRYLDRVEYS